MSKQNWSQHEDIEGSIKKILKKDPMTINLIKEKLIESGKNVSYGLVQRRIEAMNKQGIIKEFLKTKTTIFWKLA